MNMKMAHSYEVGQNLKRTLLFVCFCLLNAELNSIFLFLWPLDHSCAPKPVNLTGSSYEIDWTDAGGNGDRSNNATSLIEILETVFDRPYLRDTDTLARAHVMGIKQDDIARCYMNKIEDNRVINVTTGQRHSVTTVEVGNLVACQYGYHIETHRQPLSVIGYFQLICSRQWLKVLLPLAVGLGFFAGVLLVYWLQIRESKNLEKQNSIMLVLPYNSHYEVDYREVGPYTAVWFSTIMLAILEIIYLGYSLSHPSQGEFEKLKIDGTMSPQSGYFNLCTCVFLRIFIVASCLSRVLIYWRPKPQSDAKNDKQLEENRIYYVAFAVLTIVYHAIYYPLAIRLSPDWLSLNNWLSFASVLLIASVSMIEFYGAYIKTNKIYESANQEPLSAAKPVGSDPPETCDLTPEPVKICEFCLMQAPPMGIEQSYEAYRSTTEPLDKGNKDTRAISHNFGGLHLSLIGKKILAQVWLLVFCCALNYFILIMLPNHQLLHSETIEAILEHKSHRLRTVAIADLSANSANISALNNSSIVTEETWYPVATTNLLSNTLNPVIVLWATGRLTDWLIEFLVLILHFRFLTYPQKATSQYAKLKRLFNLVNICAMVLTIQWIMIAIFRGENHLIEYGWTRCLNFFISRATSTFMIHECLTILLKLSKKVDTSEIARFVPLALSGTLAYLLASLAPLMENWNLVIVPVVLIVNNYLAYLLTQRLTKRFKLTLCPMMLDE